MKIIPFDIKSYYGDINTKSYKEYKQTLEKIEKIHQEILEENKHDKNDFFDLFLELTSFILQIGKLEEKLNDEYFTERSFEDLKEENFKLFERLLPENYSKHLTNPSYSVRIFGEELGQIMSFFCHKYSSYIDLAFQHKIFKIKDYNLLFIDVYNYIKETEIDNEVLRNMVTRLETRDRTQDSTFLLQEYNDPEFRFYTDISLNEDLNDLRYLFKYGKYISENEIAMAKFLKTYPEEKLKVLAKAVRKAFLAGFERDGKQLVNKSTIELEYSIGMERLLKEVMYEFQEIGLNATVGEIKSSEANKQVGYDHRFDRALYLNEEITDQFIGAYNKALEKNKDFLRSKAGVIQILSFGEKPFNPENKKEALKFSENQMNLFQRFISSINQNYTKYQPLSETSFSVISFPSPEIGENFEELFAEIVKINMLDSDKYERIQQIMIDVLDKADHVIVKGKEGNQTDIKVKLQPIQNPEKETIFVNSGANVNIPLGEVFTTPQLKDTNGTLHVKETYQNGVLFKDLLIMFKDGYVEKYSCTNFDTEEKNRQHVEENLLFPHKTLPMGEFAIGTNTLAYVVARKYGILDVLPILITEKTAPHFAVGDTCFQMREDVKSFNKFNHKQVTACDNEKSILRKTDRKDEAYTFKHNDIVLPFDEISHIIAVTKEKEEIEIIVDGRFVLEGTEELNKPLIEYES